MRGELSTRVRWGALAGLLAVALASVALRDQAPLLSSVMLAAFVVAGVALASRDLVFGVVLLVAAASLDTGGMLGESGLVRFTVYQVSAAGVFVLLLSRLRAERMPLVRTPLDLPVLVFIAAMGLSVLWASDRGLAMVQFARLLSSAVLAFTVVQVVRDRRQAMSVVGMSLAVAATLAVLAVVEWTGAFALRYPVLRTSGYGIRARVTFHDPNILASFLVMTALFALALALSSRERRSRALLSLGILFVTAGVLVTYSRGAMGALIIGTVAVVVLSRLSGRARLAVLAIIALTFAVGAAVVIDAQWIQANVVDLKSNDSAMWRVAVAEGAVRMWRDAPMGVGLGNFAEVFTRYQVPGTTGVTDSHTAYLTILAEAGIFGIASFLWLLWRFFRRATLPSMHGVSPGVRALAVGAFSAGLALCAQSFTYSLEASKFLWLTFGLGASAWVLARNEPDTLQPARDVTDVAPHGDSDW